MDDDVVRTIDETGFSDDYELLFELMQRRSVICVVDWEKGDGSTRDIAHTIYAPKFFQVGVRGIGYIWANSKESFIKSCEQYHLKWLPQ